MLVSSARASAGTTSLAMRGSRLASRSWARVVSTPHSARARIRWRRSTMGSLSATSMLSQPVARGSAATH